MRQRFGILAFLPLGIGLLLIGVFVVLPRLWEAQLAKESAARFETALADANSNENHEKLFSDIADEGGRDFSERTERRARTKA